jgi:hypothetical protein
MEDRKMANDLIFEFPAYLLPEFLEKLKKVNKKLAKFKQKIEIINQHHYTCSNMYNGLHVKEERLKIIVNKPNMVGISGVEYIGTINEKDGMKTTFSVTEEIKLSDIIPRCDHCKINRYRNIHHIFKKDEQLIVVGSSCCKDYFGHDIHRMLLTYQKEIKEIDEYMLIGGGKRFTPIDIYIIAASYTVNTCYAWKKEVFWDAVTGLCETSPKHQHEVISYRNSISQQYVDGLKQKIQETVFALEGENDFECNLKSTLLLDDNSLRLWYPRGGGLVGYAVFMALNPKKEEPRQKIKPTHTSQYIGNVKERIERTLIVCGKSVCFSRFGETQLIRFKDELGNLINWFSSRFFDWEDGAVVNAKFTVKRHDSYNGNRITYITRLKTS